MNDGPSPPLIVRRVIDSILDQVPEARVVALPQVGVVRGHSPVADEELLRGGHLLGGLLRGPVIEHPKGGGYLVGGVAEEAHCLDNKLLGFWAEDRGADGDWCDGGLESGDRCWAWCGLLMRSGLLGVWSVIRS